MQTAEHGPWLRFHKRGLGDFIQFVRSGALNAFAAPGHSISPLTPYAVDHAFKNAGRSLALMEKEGLIHSAPVLSVDGSKDRADYQWTEIGRSMAVAVALTRHTIVPNEDDPLPLMDGVWLDYLLDAIEPPTMVFLVKMPAITVRQFTDANLDVRWINLLRKGGLIAERRNTTSIDWAVPREAVLDFFRRHPWQIPSAREMHVNKRHLSEGTAQKLLPFLDELHMIRAHASMSDPTEDIWDLL